MKRVLSFLLVFLLLPACSLGNSWGLTGSLLSAVMDDHTWDDYTSAGNQAGNTAIMTSRYHNALMLVMDKKSPLEVYTRAVWQPDDEPRSPNLERHGDGFVLTYGMKGTDERYTFSPSGDSYMLTAANIGNFTLTLTGDDGLYIAAENGQTARFYLWGGLTLERFSIRLLPRSVEEVRRWNEMRAALDSGSDLLGWYENAMKPGRLHTPGKKGTLPVYSAPSDKAWRASKGKASVSLNGEIFVLREWVNEKGEIWLHIRYEVSQCTHRFGFIKASDLPGYKVVGSDANQKISVPVRTAVTTTLTDDPLCSQYAQTLLPAGTELECIGMFNDEYALVRTTLDKKEAWLFAPLKDLEPVQGQPAEDAMAKLTGCWFFWAGGNMSSDYLRFYPGGGFDNPAYPDNHGTFIVTAYDSAQGKYWDNPPYEITFRYADGRVNIKGLSFDTDQIEDDEGILRDGFGLTNWEGGGGYIRMDEEDVPDWISSDGVG